MTPLLCSITESCVPRIVGCRICLSKRMNSMRLFQRGKSWYYDFLDRSERYADCIGPVSRTVEREILAKKKAEVVEGPYELPLKKPGPKLDNFGKEYLAYCQVNRRPRSAERQGTSYRAMYVIFGHARL
jgi:hypothetical protein